MWHASEPFLHPNVFRKEASRGLWSRIPHSCRATSLLDLENIMEPWLLHEHFAWNEVKWTGIGLLEVPEGPRPDECTQAAASSISSHPNKYLRAFHGGPYIKDGSTLDLKPRSLRSSTSCMYTLGPRVFIYFELTGQELKARVELHHACTRLLQYERHSKSTHHHDACHAASHHIVP